MHKVYFIIQKNSDVPACLYFNFMPESTFYKYILATHKTNKLKQNKTY